MNAQDKVVDNLASMCGGRVTVEDLKAAFGSEFVYAHKLGEKTLLVGPLIQEIFKILEPVADRVTDPHSSAQLILDGLFTLTLVKCNPHCLPWVPNIRFVDRLGECHYLVLHLKYPITKPSAPLVALQNGLTAKLALVRAKALFSTLNVTIPSTEYGDKFERLIASMNDLLFEKRPVLELGMFPSKFWTAISNGIVIRTVRAARSARDPDIAAAPKITLIVGSQSMIVELISIRPDIPIEKFLNEVVLSHLEESISKTISDGLGIDIPCSIERQTMD